MTKFLAMARPSEQTMPNTQLLLSNYAQMLRKDRPQFLETLYRAVKLDKVEALRVLCRIVERSGLSLDSSEMREPESSATILHVALLYNHHDAVDFLLKTKSSSLILAKYETCEYRNQTGLHLAVSNGNRDVIEKLLCALEAPERQVLINTVADGDYFRKKHPHGQLCVTAAAWAGHCDVVKLLVKHGGDLALRNTKGNTLLHSIVVQSSTHSKTQTGSSEQVFDAVWEAALISAQALTYRSKNDEHRNVQQQQMQADIFKHLLRVRNHDGFTPLALAVARISPLLPHMLSLDRVYKIPQSKLGSVAWVTYDVGDITSFASGSYNKFSVLHILAHNGELLSRGADPNMADDVDTFSLEPIRTVQEKKWSVYRWVYNCWFFVHILYMFTFTALTIEANSNPYKGEKRIHWALSAFLVLPILYILFEILDLFGSRPYKIELMSRQNLATRFAKCVRSEWTIMGNGPYRLAAQLNQCELKPTVLHCLLFLLAGAFVWASRCPCSSGSCYTPSETRVRTSSWRSHSFSAGSSSSFSRAAVASRAASRS